MDGDGEVRPMGSIESDLELQDPESGDGLRLMGEWTPSDILSGVGIFFLYSYYFYFPNILTVSTVGTFPKLLEKFLVLN